MTVVFMASPLANSVQLQPLPPVTIGSVALLSLLSFTHLQPKKKTAPVKKSQVLEVHPHYHLPSIFLNPNFCCNIDFRSCWLMLFVFLVDASDQPMPVAACGHRDLAVGQQGGLAALCGFKSSDRHQGMQYSYCMPHVELHPALCPLLHPRQLL